MFIKDFLGITRASCLLRLKSIHFPHSFPTDVMHAILQNITPMLFRLWNGTLLPELDQRGSPSDYVITEELREIGRNMAGARQQIPASLGHAPRDIFKHYNGFKAAEWKAWLLLYGPSLLEQRLPEKYLVNFRDLRRIYFLSTKQCVTATDVQNIHNLAIKFVRNFEDLYYRHEVTRLSVCRINVHSLLHLAKNIEACASAAYWWQFPMER